MKEKKKKTCPECKGRKYRWVPMQTPPNGVPVLIEEKCAPCNGTGVVNDAVAPSPTKP